MKRALVIGGTGFIGLSIVDALLERGVDVRVSRRKQSITLLVRKRPVELVDASLEDRAALTKAMEDCEYVFLAAGHYPRYSTDRAHSIAVGVRGVRNAFDAALAAGVKRVIFTSSTATLAQAPAGRIADERDRLRAAPTDSVYRAVKFELEREAEEAASRGLDVVTVLPGGCIGPGDLRVGTAGLFVGVVRSVMPWYVEGTVNVVDVTDVGRTHVEAAIRARRGARYCIAGHPVELGELLQLVARRYGGQAPTTCLDPQAARARADADEAAAAPKKQRVPFPREMVDIVTSGQPVSSERARRDLGIEPTPLPLALDRTHAWLVRCKHVPAIDAAPRRIHEPG